MSQNWRQSEICIVINSKSLDSQPGIYVMMGYFITNLSINLLVKGVDRLLIVYGILHGLFLLQQLRTVGKGIFVYGWCLSFCQ